MFFNCYLYSETIALYYQFYSYFKIRLQSSRAVLSKVDLYLQKYVWCTYTCHRANKVFTYGIMNLFKIDIDFV